MPTKSLGCCAVPLTPASPTIPMAKPAARPARPTESPAPSWTKPCESDISTWTVRGMMKQIRIMGSTPEEGLRTVTGNENGDNETVDLKSQAHVRVT